MCTRRSTGWMGSSLCAMP
uniref:Uncharacterized protein n=1 Tax=Arundo donax TaxID=35708 RepID=A0A0A9AR82_ARUDO